MNILYQLAYEKQYNSKAITYKFYQIFMFLDYDIFL